MLKSENIIIIASQPRSGSTLLQALLSNNGKVGTVSEPWLLLPFLGYQSEGVQNSVYNSKLALIGINDFKSKIGEKEFEIDLSNFLLSQYQKILKGDEMYVLDKTPRYYEILDEIVRYFPEAKIVILKRNPLAVLSSIIKTWNSKSLNSLLQYKRDLLNAPYMLHEFSEKQKNNPNVFTIKYEDIVVNPEINLSKLYLWLGLEYHSNVLNFSENYKFQGKMGDTTGVKLSSTPNIESLDKWRTIYDNNRFGSFARGYADFLGENFLKEYGEYHQEPKYGNTKLFNRYYEMSDWEFNEQHIPKLKLIKNAFLRKIGCIED
ncbi:sulfotransferase [Mangrovimonas sp. DI 80]|uniref:sulfotransferase family protein n=1 Tax=Mangrovimonas sp. DI 80 TaxID=1779330 RepID=UPI000975B753|nr:sulfotransferase [Mangrovimonas sp. DI 80]OMP31789.1 hypothetical protein BKM32_01635 [Mangrovimonas sp. DI 80]